MSVIQLLIPPISLNITTHISAVACSSAHYAAYQACVCVHPQGVAVDAEYGSCLRYIQLVAIVYIRFYCSHSYCGFCVYVYSMLRFLFMLSATRAIHFSPLPHSFRMLLVPISLGGALRSETVRMPFPPAQRSVPHQSVVSYLFSTSNHNAGDFAG